ncbi:restriction endonuclease subunit S [Ureaplasma diversum]|nr:restriction endonuclease subunit S [Ureaplasma diversum]
MPFIQVVDVSSSMNLVDDSNQKISSIAQPMSVFTKAGSILVTLQGTIGRAAITQYDAYVDRTILIFEKYKINIDPRFWAYIIKLKFQTEATKAPGGIIKTITIDALSKFQVLIPNLPEQQKIANFFSQLDNLISL